MHCAHCEHENPPQARFCLECGTSFMRQCAHCGTELPRTAKFCLECGERVDEATASPVAGVGRASATRPGRRSVGGRPGPESERRQVTVLFADVANFTALAEALDPERVHAIMDQCFRLLSDEVRRYEGTVNQFTGDGIMALFGAPVANEHAPEHAVRAALGMQAALRHYGAELRQTHDLDFQMRIGINTGPVVVGTVGDDEHGDYTALGDTTNVAARLEAVAPTGGVLISESTARLVSRRFVTRSRGSVALKGKSKPVEAFEVLRALPRTPLLPVSEHGLTPLVGREAELQQLETLFASAAAGRGQIAFVVGEAGIGKSRVIHEFRERLAEQNLTWLEGRCVSFGREFPFLPVIDVFKAGFAIEESDTEAVIIEKVHRGIAALGPEPASTEPYVRTLLAVEPGDTAVAAMDASARRFGIFDALKRLTCAAAARRPQVILIEDLHWIDQGSDEYLTFIADAIATAPILLLCTYRPGYRPTLGERSYVSRLALQPLSPAETTAMAAGMVDAGEFPPEIQQLILGKAEGNPFFIEEVTKSLVEMEAVTRSANGYALARPISEIVIPDTIQDVIMARIDRLGEAPKRAIQIASVIGREFAVRLLQRAADFGDGVQKLVGELRALELIYEKSGVPELAYMFKHALTHDVAYGSLLVQRRKELHLIIGRATEELYADRLTEHCETLAHHFYRAEEWPTAFRYLVEAGGKALGSFANREALHYFDRALEIADRLALEPSQRAGILKGKGRAHFGLSEFPEAVDVFRDALALVTETPDRGLVTIGLGWALLWMHEFDGAIAIAEEAGAIARALDDTDLASNAIFLEGFAKMSRGEVDEGESCYERALVLCGTAGIRSRAATIRGFGALVANWRGNYARAIPEMEAAVATLKEENELLDLAMHYSTMTIALGGAGEYARGLACASEGIGLSESIGERVWRARTWNSRGWILGELGAFEEAEEANRRCLEIAETLGSLRMTPELVGNAEANLADLALWRGDPGAAEPRLAAVAAIVDDPRNEWMVWRYRMHCQVSSAELALLRGDLGRARDLVTACLAAARRTRSRRYIVRATRLLANCHIAAGNLAEAETLLAGAVEDARALGNPPQLWHALFAHGRVLDGRGKRDEATAAWRDALGVVEATAAALPSDVRSAFGASPIRQALGEVL